jgi:hypothetical protein
VIAVTVNPIDFACALPPCPLGKVNRSSDLVISPGEAIFVEHAYGLKVKRANSRRTHRDSKSERWVRTDEFRYSE